MKGNPTTVLRRLGCLHDAATALTAAAVTAKAAQLLEGRIAVTTWTPTKIPVSLIIRLGWLDVINHKNFESHFETDQGLPYIVVNVNHLTHERIPEFDILRWQ